MPANQIIFTARTLAFGAVTLLSLITLALSAHMLSPFAGSGFYPDFAAFALAVSILSLTIPAMFYISNIRTGAFPSFIVVELGWLGFLWILWLASAATTAGKNFTGGSCSSLPSEAATFCSEMNAIEAFAFLNWLILMGYNICLLGFSIQVYQRGNTQVWSSSVKDTNFEAISQGHEKPYQSNAFAPQYPPASHATPNVAQV